MKKNRKIGTMISISFILALMMTSFSSFTTVLPSTEKKAEQNYPLVEETNSTVKDTIPYARVILYRPDNQLSRKYEVNTNTNGAFKMAKKEVRTLEVNSNVFIISMDAFGHKEERFTFNLVQNRTHYFRLQDRNNYAGFRPFLEVIEVTEETYKRENPEQAD